MAGTVQWLWMFVNSRIPAPASGVDASASAGVTGGCHVVLRTVSKSAWRAAPPG